MRTIKEDLGVDKKHRRRLRCGNQMEGQCGHDMTGTDVTHDKLRQLYEGEFEIHCLVCLLVSVGHL